MTDDQWDSLAEKYGQNVLAQKHILWPGVTAELSRHLNGKRFLDIGCGNGAYAQFASDQGATAVGIDPSEEMIREARLHHATPEYVRVAGEDYRAPEKFDIALANMVVCNIPSEDALSRFFSATYNNLKAGGQFIVTNLGDSYQRTCDTAALKQTYPARVREGSKFEISLGTTDGEDIGLFQNYHWSWRKIYRTAEEVGFYDPKIIRLQKKDAGAQEWPTYVALAFQK